ncbi:hypothetical protein YTPLAS18_31620 [Nitrospira sp.]|nr:hypothetical protein YTPLAS18_31620 [Nitrospira sp.]
MATTEGMKGGGFYDAHSSVQRAAMEEFLPWIEEAIADLPLSRDPQAPIGLLDIGSSEGGNAILGMNRLITRCREQSDRPIWACFDDLPTNDFNRLFLNLFSGQAPALSGPHIFPCAIGASAFGPVVPPQTIHVATTYNAIAFLETKPDTRLPQFIMPMTPGPLAPRAGVSVSEAERAPFARQAAKDLSKFYQARVDELVSGGKLLIQVFGRDERYSTSFGLYDVLSDAILDLTEEGVLPRSYYKGLVFPIYFRNLEELLAPVKTIDRLRQSFRVEKADSRETSVPFNEQLAATGNVAAWVSSYTGFLRAFTESIAGSALPEGRSRSEILDHIYGRVEQRLTNDPARYEHHYISVAALLTRL